MPTPRSSTAAWVLTLCASLLPLMAQEARSLRTVLIPESSIERPEAVGLRMHSNHQILLGSAAGLGPNGRGMAPSQMRAFYGMPATGGHDAIAIVDPYHYATALVDFNTFSAQFGLPTETSADVTAAANQVFQTVYAGGTQPAGDASWAQEAALDIEWAHAMAPGAKIILVEAASNRNSDLMAAIDAAAALPGVKQVTLSWGGTEFATEASYDSHFNKNGPVFFASSGDTGGQVIYPACSQYVVAVGGTSVATDAAGNWTGETAWSGGGGGNSQYVAKPAWQGAAGLSGLNRGVPDVSADADPQTGAAVYDSTPYQANSGWMVFGGTSLAAPCMAGMVNVTGGAYTNTTQLLTELYANALATPPRVRDITGGNNTLFTAQSGWDYATGVGVPLGAGSFGTPVLTAAITAPAANLTVASGALVAFAGSASDTVPGATLSYGWSFGDGASASGAAASHAFAGSGGISTAYQVVFTASDGGGNSATALRTITVTPNTITPAISAPASGVTVTSGTPVAFAGSATDSSPSATLSYAWNFGDGTSASGATASHVFSNPSVTTTAYTVTLTATDSTGGSASTTCVVNVGGVSITVPVAAVGLLTGRAATFTATVGGTPDPSVAWTASTGAVITPGTPSASASFSADTPGLYTVTAAVASDPARTASLTVNVHGPVLVGTGSAVTGLDVLALAGAYGQASTSADLNGDGTVDAADLAILLQLLGW